MRRTLPDARRWMRHGTTLLLKEADLDDAALNGPCALHGWTRRRLIAHVAANAGALGNLVHWAATGEPTPMYASPRERAAGIENGAKLPAGELAGWLDRSADMLEEAMDRLTAEQWQVPVRTAQGRTVPAAEVPWLRSPTSPPTSPGARTSSPPATARPRRTWRPGSERTDHAHQP
jgi:uncharacterized protein (TIGR03083 family)